MRPIIAVVPDLHGSIKKGRARGLRDRASVGCEVARLAGVQFRYCAPFFIFFLSQATQSPSSPHFPFPLPTPIQRRCRILDNVSLNTNPVTLSPRLHFPHCHHHEVSRCPWSLRLPRFCTGLLGSLAYTDGSVEALIIF